MLVINLYNTLQINQLSHLRRGNSFHDSCCFNTECLVGDEDGL